MSGVVVRALVVMLAVVFLWAAVSKVALGTRWRSSLGAYGLGVLAPLVAFGVPVLEIATGALLLVAPMKAGAAAALALLSLFSLGLLRARMRQGERVPCGCFGRTKERDYRVLLARNALLALAAAVILVSRETGHLLHGATLPASEEAVPALLVVVGVVTIVWIALGVVGSFRKGSSS